MTIRMYRCLYCGNLQTTTEPMIEGNEVVTPGIAFRYCPDCQKICIMGEVGARPPSKHGVEE
jgi:hypothetical protein